MRPEGDPQRRIELLKCLRMRERSTWCEVEHLGVRAVEGLVRDGGVDVVGEEDARLEVDEVEASVVLSGMCGRA
jgi:hypothetical protein